MPIKPIADFYSQWQEVRKTIEHKHDGQKIVVVGGGAGSVETILAMAHSLESDPATRGKCRFTLVYKNSELLPGYSSGLIAKVKTACLRYGIQLKADFNVVRVEHNSLYGSENATEDFDFLFWCTHASAASWTADSGLACDEDGFVTVNTCLQSVSSPDVFAAGDIAHMEANPRPKAGVYAVRQGPYLYDNLRARILGEPLKNYVPQRQFLSLLALGDKNAVGLRAPFPAFCGAWVWRWKNNIDQKFMSGFSKLPPKAPNKSN